MVLGISFDSKNSLKAFKEKYRIPFNFLSDYEKNIGKELSGSYYDRPWYYSSNREINFFVRIDFD